jgi:DNA polymerase III epsilon subunit-like protein
MATIYVGVDIETTGPNMATNYMIAFGAYAISYDPVNNVATSVDKFYGAMSPPTKLLHGFDEKCYAEYWSKQPDLLKKFEQDAKDPREVMPAFYAWISKLSNVIIVSDFPEYDVAWINMYLALYASKGPLYLLGGFNPTIAIDDIYRGNLNAGGWGVTKRISDKYGFTPKNETHHPTEDAEAIVTNYVNFLIKSKFIQ